MIVLDIELPHDCNDCPLQDEIGNCMPGDKADYSRDQRPENCPIKGKIEIFEAS